MKEKLNILFVSPWISMGRGGLERVGTFAANTLHRLGHNVHFAFYTREGKEEPLFPVDDGINLVPISLPAGITTKNRYKEKRKVLTKLLDENDIDVFFVQYGGFPIIEYFSIAYEYKDRVAFGYQEATNPKRLVTTNWAEKKECAVAQAILERETVASFACRVRQTMPSYINSLPEYIQPQVFYFPNAIEVPEEYIGKKLKREKSILYVGGRKLVKRPELLIQAFAKVADEAPEWTLDICGGTFDREIRYNKFLDEIIEEHSHLKDRITFHGELDNIYDFYSKAGVHVITSAQEGRPTCVGEAMAMGVPSIGYDYCPGTNELIRHGENGILVGGEDDVESLAEGLREVILNEDKLQRFSDKCYEDAKDFTPDNVSKYWSRLFQEIASYKGEHERVFEEQYAIDKSKAKHSKRMQKVLYEDLIKEYL